ncbi:hypothetical protein GOBAR_DD12958 [Gossypium barbadense]|nr:hypothetical protein GOBAR_DD12958 [Gossypium barbadense]
MHRIGQVDDENTDHNDVHDKLTEFQQQLDEQAAALKQTNAILRTLTATINEMRLDQEPQYRGPIKDDVDNQPRAHRHAPRRVSRTDYDSSLSSGSKQSNWKKGAPIKTQTPSKQPNLSNSNVNWTREIECFKCKGCGHYSRECPNTRFLLMKDNGNSKQPKFK